MILHIARNPYKSEKKACKMTTMCDIQKEQQGNWFKTLLHDIVFPRHVMVKLADTIDWQRTVSLLVRFV